MKQMNSKAFPQTTPLAIHPASTKDLNRFDVGLREQHNLL
jgi:hypothetical protein